MNSFTLDSTKQTVGFLYAEEFEGDGLKKVPIGTCFFVANKIGKFESCYLVTAKHVLKDLQKGDGQMFVRLNQTGMSGVAYVPLPPEGWVIHKDPEIDLVVLPFFPGKTAAGDVTMMAIPLEVMSQSKLYADQLDRRWPPQECDEVFLVGLALQHQGSERNYPIVRMGHIALSTDDLLDLEGGRANYFLIDIQSYRGNSGAPVWVYYGDGYNIFLGVLTLAFRSESEFTEGKTYLNVGISAVVPARSLLEVVTSIEGHLTGDRDRPVSPSHKIFVLSTRTKPTAG